MGRLGLATVAMGMLGAAGIAGTAAWGQTPAESGAVPAATHHSCTVLHAVATDADRAMLTRRYAEAETIYRAQQAAAAPGDEAGWSAATAGIIRSQLAQAHVSDALALARASVGAHAGSAALADALGEAEMRDGEPEAAVSAFNRALALDPCEARTHFDVSRYLNLSGLRGGGRRELEMAHRLSPDDPAIDRSWQAATAAPLTTEQRIARLRIRMNEPEVTTEQRAGFAEAIRAIEAGQRGDCQLVGTVETAKMELVPIANGPQRPLYALGLDVQFNGKRKRLELDTGASGLLISRSAAASAGLVPEAEVTTGGIGDEGRKASFLTHVDDLKVGGMEFRNCMVRVLEQRNVLEVDGLIGPDVFRQYLVTLDLPGRELRLAPLPKRPEEPATAEAKTLATTGEGSAEAGATRAAPKDRYIAPEMKDWSRIYRVGHDLIVPTKIGEAPVKLFILDTGAASPLISPEVAREVTHVSGDTSRRVRGISGEVKHVSEAESVTIAFAGVRQQLQGMTAIDTSNISRGVGVGIAGFIGFPTLRELEISIDYRDNLLHVAYDPKHGFHAH